MGKKVCEKLHSGKGTSLLLSMLLLLVCTVMGSVLLVAATTTNGSAFSPQEDKDYYALTSAAELLRAELGDRCAQMRITTVDESTKQYRWCTVDARGALIDTGVGDFAREMAVLAIGTPASGQSQKTLVVSPDTFTIVPSCGTEEQTELKVTAEMTVNRNANTGTLRSVVMKLRNAGEGKTGSLIVTFTADIRREEIMEAGNNCLAYTVIWAISDMRRSVA